jgi:hypothetical protein
MILCTEVYFVLCLKAKDCLQISSPYLIHSTDRHVQQRSLTHLAYFLAHAMSAHFPGDIADKPSTTAGTLAVHHSSCRGEDVMPSQQPNQSQNEAQSMSNNTAIAPARNLAWRLAAWVVCLTLNTGREYPN